MSIVKKIETIEEYDDQLNDWERNFIDSIRNQLERGCVLTENQVEKIEQIYEKVG